MAEKKKKETKPRAEKYESKLAVKGTFEELLKTAVTDTPKEKVKSDKKKA